jgi:hypothetical protein
MAGDEEDADGFSIGLLLANLQRQKEKHFIPSTLSVANHFYIYERYKFINSRVEI